jgi:hypothetical protein
MSRKGRRGRGNKSSSIAPAQAAGVEQVVEAREEKDADRAIESAAIAEALTAETPARPHVEPAVAHAKQEEAAPAKAAPTGVHRDDSSYPPVDLDNHFFDSHHHARNSEPPHEADEHDPRMVLKLTPEVAQRRRNLQKYVKIAVAAASALCLAAVVKVTLARGSGEEGTARPIVAAAAAQQVAPPPVPVVVEPVVAPTPPAETQAAPTPPPPPAETAAPAAPPPAEPVAAAAAPAAAPAETAAAAPAAAAEPDPKAAAKEKNACRNALERGKVADAIEAGERSVALDPTDAEAWLILGASYQEKGDMKNARRSYKACLEQGKRGPKYECAAMPH